MVLHELGAKINEAFRKLSKESDIDEKVLDAILKDICTALLTSDVNVMRVRELRDNVKKSVNIEELGATANKKRVIEKVVFEELCNLVDPGVQAWQPKKGKFNVIMTVGLQGSGKTTTCTKLASFYHRKGWKIGLVCADTFRAGAFDQLKQNATKAHIPYYGSYNEADPVQIAREGVEKFKQEKFEIVIVDTSGRHKQESQLFDEMTQISNSIDPDNVIFVMDGTIGQSAEAQATAFKDAVNVGSVVLTKMDGHAKGGGAISAVAATKSPIIFIGTGEHVHDIEKFSARPFISKMLGMGDIAGLVDAVKDLRIEDNKDLMQNLSKGIFTLKDLRDQLEMIMKLGPLNKIAGMIPGLPQDALKGMDSEAGTKQLKQFMCIFDSMTEKELYSDGKIFTAEPSRLERVARGSGTSKAIITAMLARHKAFAGFVKNVGGASKKGMGMPGADKLAKGMGGRGFNPNNMTPQQMSKMQSQMSSMFGPDVMQSINSAGGIGNIMKQMSGGGLGGMQDMFSKMMGRK